MGLRGVRVGGRAFMGVLCLALLTVMAGTAAASDDQETARTLVHMLGYVGVDYPATVANGKIVNAAEYAEQQEFAARVGELIATLPEQPAKAALVADAGQLKRDIEARVPGDIVAERTRKMRDALILSWRVVIAPRALPDLQRGAALYARDCAGCHGASGAGDGAAGAALDPPPTDFRDRARAGQRSVFALYNTITLGVDGTGMAGFGQLSDADRWALAFHVSRFGATDAERAQGAADWPTARAAGHFSDLAAITRISPEEARARFGASGPAVLAWLRAHPEAVASGAESPIAISRRLLAESVAQYGRGERERAYATAVAAYLDGFELAENGLNAVDSTLKVTIEERMLAFRGLLQKGAPDADVRAEADAIAELLATAESKLGTANLTPGAAFASSAIIILREGLEAILLLAVIVAFLTKTGRRDAIRYVHAGWTAALALGGVTWLVATRVITISGASRELTEGATALLAAAVLLYVGFWLHNKLHAARWREFIEGTIGGALSRGALMTIAGVAFIAVYREVFETVLFYQALWLQAGAAGQQMVLYGFLTAAGTLVVLTWLIFRASVRLPLRAFFAVNSVLMYLLAVVFAGKGIAGLQEAGVLPVTSVRFPRVDLLGIYPNAQSLGLQAALVVAAIVFVYFSRRKSAA